MKSLRLLTLVCVVLALTFTAIAGDQVPLKGTFGTNFTITSISPGVISVPVNGSGIVSDLGSATISITQILDFTKLPAPDQTGTFTLTAANGDTLHGTVLGTALPPDQNLIGTFSGTMTVTGGTGRYQGASGTLLYSGMANLNTLQGVFSIGGTVSSPGSLK